MGLETQVKEIRICWNVAGRIAIDGEDHFGGLWAPDTPENRRDYEIVVEAGNEAYGPDSHWIEQREA